MKKVACVISVLFLIFTGCVNTNPNPRAKVIEKDNLSILKQINTDKNGISATSSKYGSWFDINSNDLISLINDYAVSLGYEELELLDSSSESQLMLTRDGDTWFIIIKSKVESSGNNYVREVELSLYADDKERSVVNGDFLYLLFNIFNPDMREQISNELYLFDEAPSDYPTVRQLICGNVWYSYIYKPKGISEFTIKSFAPYEESSKNPDAIRPS